jgi:hypothetical protein
MPGPRILTLDIETQRAIVETFSLYRPFIGIDRVVHPSRVLCFAARWYGQDKNIFKAAWEDPWKGHVQEGAYENLIQSAFDLLDEADFVVTWNGDRFDWQWLESEFVRVLGRRPSPYKSVDLIKTVKKNFRAGLLSMKLDWSARTLLKDAKVQHGGADLWHDIRWGTTREQAAARKLMRQYNIHDTELTERIFDKYRPWLTINVGPYYDDGEDHCTSCGGTDLSPRGYAYTPAGKFRQYHCNSCKSWPRGSKRLGSTSLRHRP